MTTAQLAARMQKAADQLPTSRLIEAVQYLGGSVLPADDNMVRAALLNAYETRAGDAAAKALMNEIGL